MVGGYLYFGGISCSCEGVELTWTRGGTVVGTGGEYHPTVDDAGHVLTLTAIARKSYFNDATTHTDTAPVAPASFTTGPAATVAGTAKVGQTLTASVGNAAPAPDRHDFQWYADGTPIPGANGSTLTLTGAQLNAAITVQVTAVRYGYAPTSRTSAPTMLVAPATFTTNLTTSISGAAQVGQTLTADIGPAVPGPDRYDYQWYANGAPIPGATAGSLTLTAAQQGAKITVQATAVRYGYTSISRTSAPTAMVLTGTFGTGPTAAITGTAKVGTTLNATVGRSVPAPDRHDFQWYADGAPIFGANDWTLTLSAHSALSSASVITAALAIDRSRRLCTRSGPTCRRSVPTKDGRAGARSRPACPRTRERST